MESEFPDIGTGVPGVLGCGDPSFAARSEDFESRKTSPIMGRKEAQKAQKDCRDGGWRGAGGGPSCADIDLICRRATEMETGYDDFTWTKPETA